MWNKLLSRKRCYGQDKLLEDGNQEYYRSSFHKDYDRLIFSNAFRRMSRKTQVHPLAKNDHVHNRLTHSLEVASVGRTLGIRAGEILMKRDPEINPYDIAYIVQTACLAHDVGNPPFGHAGEEVIKEWFRKNEDRDFLKELTQEQRADFHHLDGNAQSFRTVTQLENNIFEGGMNLTFATLGTLVKYPYSSSRCEETGKSKFNFFRSEEAFFNLLFDELGLKLESGGYRRHPLSYLMEASDDICYGLLDLQDACELGIITPEDIRPIFEDLSGSEKTAKIYADDQSDIRKVSNLVAVSINNLVNHSMDTFEKHLDEITHGGQPKDLISLFFDDRLKEGIQKAKAIGPNRIFNEGRKIELELGAYNIIETLLYNLIGAAFELYEKGENSLSFRNKRALEMMGNSRPKRSESLYEIYQRVADYIIGMTDNYAKYVAGQFKGLGD